MTVEVNNFYFVQLLFLDFTSNWDLSVPIVYDSVVYFFPEIWTDLLFVNCDFVVCEMETLAFGSEVIEKKIG